MKLASVWHLLRKGALYLHHSRLTEVDTNGGNIFATRESHGEGGGEKGGDHLLFPVISDPPWEDTHADTPTRLAWWCRVIKISDNDPN